MPSTVYKGDLTEVTFGHESGMDLTHDYASTFRFIAKANASWPNIDTSIITFSGGPSGSPVHSGVLKYPTGMLVGSRLVFSGITSAFSTADNHSNGGPSYTIVKHEVVSGATELTISPALKTDHSSAVTSANGTLRILPYKTPSMDTGMVYHATANESGERVLTDQFVGLIGTIALPETTVDLKRYHVVGLGRDVAVQVPGRFLNQGGSFETNLHNARWFYYALGHEVTSVSDPEDGHASDTFSINGAIEAGDSSFAFDSSGTTDPVINGVGIGPGDYIVLVDTNTTDINVHRETTSDGTWPSQGSQSIISMATKQETRRVVAISDTNGIGTIWVDDPFNFSHADNTVVEFVRFEADGSRGSPHMSTASASYGNITNPTKRLLFSRTTVPSFAMEVSIRRNDSDSGVEPTEVTDGGASDSKQLTRVFRGCKVKDWSLTADTDAAVRMTVNFDAALCYTDTGRLGADKATATLTALSKTAGQANTRVLTLSDGTNSVNFSIDNSTSTSTATVIGFSNANSNANQFATNIAAAVNAANTADTLNMSAIASSATVTLTQNDNGVAGNTTPSGTAISDSVITLSSAFSGGQVAGDRYDCHRLFEDTANTEQKRKDAGIAKRTQKPFMFYNGTMQVGGVTLGQVVSFTLNGSTGVEQYYTITGANVPDSATDQVPFAGTRNPAIAVEGKTEYDLEMEIIVDDPLFYHKMRRAVDHFDDDTSDTTDADMIRLSFTKQGAGATRETMDIVMDDYFIVEAPLPIPEDKGPIRSTLKILPKSVRVVAVDTLLHS